MGFLAKKDNAKSTINDNPLLVGATTINLASGGGAKFPTTADGNWIATIWDKTNYPDPGDDPQMEEVLVTARTTDALTVTRGYNGTTAYQHAQGQAIALFPLSKHFEELQNMGQSAFSGWEAPAETPDGSRTHFSTSAMFANGLLIVTRNGQVQQVGQDFTQDTGYQGYTFNTAPATGAIIRHWYIKNSTILIGSASKWKEMVAVTGTQDGLNKVFTTPSNYISGSVTVLLNGIAQTPTTEYTESAVNQITFATGNEPASTDTIRVCYLEGTEAQGNAQSLGGLIPSYYCAPGDLLNGKIVRTVASNNITLAIKCLDGTDPSTTQPVYSRIGDTPVTITSPLSVTVNAGANTMNLGGAELVTQDTDLFAYLIRKASDGSIILGFSRIPSGNTYADFSGTATNEKYIAVSATPASTDKTQNIGRFNAKLGASATYYWSIPATDVTISQPTYETRLLNWTPVHSRIVTNYTSLPTGIIAVYKLIGNTVDFFESHQQAATPGGSGNQHYTLPFISPYNITGTGINTNSVNHCFPFISSGSNACNIWNPGAVIECVGGTTYTQNARYLI